MPFTQIGEPKATLLVENNIIGAAQRIAAYFRIQHLDLAGRQINALNAPARIVFGNITGKQQAVHIVPFKAAIIANIDRAIGANGRAVRPAAGFGNHFDFSVRGDTAQRAARNLNQYDRAIGHGNRPFGK